MDPNDPGVQQLLQSLAAPMPNTAVGQNTSLGIGPDPFGMGGGVPGAPSQSQGMASPPPAMPGDMGQQMPGGGMGGDPQQIAQMIAALQGGSNPQMMQPPQMPPPQDPNALPYAPAAGPQ